MAFNESFQLNFGSPLNSVTNDELDEILSLNNSPPSKQKTNKTENLFGVNKERLSTSENITPNILREFEEEFSLDSLPNSINLNLSFLKTPEKEKNDEAVNKILKHVDFSTSLDSTINNLKAQFNNITSDGFLSSQNCGIFDELDELSIPLPTFLRTNFEPVNPLSSIPSNSQKVKNLSNRDNITSTIEPSTSQFSDKFEYQPPLANSTVNFGSELPLCNKKAKVTRTEIDNNNDTTITDPQLILNDNQTSTSTNFLDSIATLPSNISTIPKSVFRLYETVTNSFSDFAFVYALSAQMCQDIMPMDGFVNLKMGLLLSIASIEVNSSRPPIFIVGIGQEERLANKIMVEIGNVARRFVYPFEDFNLSHVVNDTMIGSGSISKAKSGVCYLGNLSRIRPGQADKFFRELEKGKVESAAFKDTFPIECAVWCYWSSYQFNAKNESVFTKLLEVFGIPFLIEDEISENYIDFVLEQNSVQSFEKSIDELSISQEDMRTFLDVISRRKVDTTPIALEIMQNYYMASRVERPDCLSQKAFEVMQRLAESFAKLSCRYEVIAIDAIAAIYLSESFIINLFGPGASPPPKFTNHNYIGDVDTFMSQFQEWLSEYLDKFSKEPDICLSL